MRRSLSIFLVLLFWLGPLATLLPGSDDVRLPACCRRHGAHHCAMSMGAMGMMAEAATGEHVLTAPSTCPAFPGFGDATTSTMYALPPGAVGMSALLAERHSPAAGRAAARISQIRTRVGRGPPAASLA